MLVGFIKIFSHFMWKIMLLYFSCTIYKYMRKIQLILCLRQHLFVNRFSRKHVKWSNGKQLSHCKSLYLPKRRKIPSWKPRFKFLVPKTLSRFVKTRNGGKMCIKYLDHYLWFVWHFKHFEDCMIVETLTLLYASLFHTCISKTAW